MVQSLYSPVSVTTDQEETTMNNWTFSALVFLIRAEVFGSHLITLLNPSLIHLGNLIVNNSLKQRKYYPRGEVSYRNRGKICQNEFLKGFKIGRQFQRHFSFCKVLKGI